MGEHPCLFHAHFMKATPVLFHLVPADSDVSQYMLNKKEINRYILISD